MAINKLNFSGVDVGTIASPQDDFGSTLMKYGQQLNESERQKRLEAERLAENMENRRRWDVANARAEADAAIQLKKDTREDADRAALQQFSKGMLEPYAISNIVTDTVTPEQISRIEFTPEESSQYTAVGGDLSKMTGSAKNKAELQLKLSGLADQVAASPEYQETGYETAKRVAGGLDTITPEVYDQLKAYQVADATAQKERLSKQAEYSAQAKEIDTKIAELKAKQGAKADDIIGLGKEWGKKIGTNGVTVKSMGYDELIKLQKETVGTDSSPELNNMLKVIFDNPNLTKDQKVDSSNNLLISSGAYNAQGLFDIGKKNIDIEAAKKANEEYFANIKNISPKRLDSSEIAGIQGQIDLLESQKAGLNTKAGLYDKDRTEAAKVSLGNRVNQLLGVSSSATTDGNTYSGNKAIQIVENKEGPLTDEMKYVISNEGYSDKPYIDKAGRREVQTVGVGQTGDYKDKTFKETYDDRLNILKKQVPQLDSLPSEVRKTLIDNHYRGEIGSNTIKLINEGKYAEAGDAFLKNRKDYNEDTPQQIKNRMDSLVNSLKSVQPKQEPDIKQLFANVKDAKQEQKVTQDFSKLTELYKSLGGTGGSAGPIDYFKINKEAESLSKITNTPIEDILSAVKSQARQDTLTDSRNKIISNRMFDLNMNKLKNDPKVKEDYAEAWKNEALKRKYTDTGMKHLDIESFIKQTYPEKLQYK